MINYKQLKAKMRQMKDETFLTPVDVPVGTYTAKVKGVKSDEKRINVVYALTNGAINGLIGQSFQQTEQGYEMLGQTLNVLCPDSDVTDIKVIVGLSVVLAITHSPCGEYLRARVKALVSKSSAFAVPDEEAGDTEEAEADSDTEVSPPTKPSPKKKTVSLPTPVDGDTVTVMLDGDEFTGTYKSKGKKHFFTYDDDNDDVADYEFTLDDLVGVVPKQKPTPKKPTPKTVESDDDANGDGDGGVSVPSKGDTITVRDEEGNLFKGIYTGTDKHGAHFFTCDGDDFEIELKDIVWDTPKVKPTVKSKPTAKPSVSPAKTPSPKKIVVKRKATATYDVGDEVTVDLGNGKPATKKVVIEEVQETDDGFAYTVTIKGKEMLITDEHIV